MGDNPTSHTLVWQIPEQNGDPVDYFIVGYCRVSNIVRLQPIYRTVMIVIRRISSSRMSEHIAGSGKASTGICLEIIGLDVHGLYSYCSYQDKDPSTANYIT